MVTFTINSNKVWGVKMLWKDHVRLELKSVWGVVPWHGVAWCKIRQFGWLLCRDGSLQAIFNGQQKPFLSILGCAGTGELSFAGGVRPQGAARLTGVLHYFTRGPNE